MPKLTTIFITPLLVAALLPVASYAIDVNIYRGGAVPPSERARILREQNNREEMRYNRVEKQLLREEYLKQNPPEKPLTRSDLENILDEKLGRKNPPPPEKEEPSPFGEVGGLGKVGGIGKVGAN